MPKCQKWTWASNLDPNQLTRSHLFQAYSLQFDNLCKIDSCRKNCKKVLCIACFDKSWIDATPPPCTDSNDSNDACDAEQQRSDIKSYVGLKNLGATCYVNCLLQLWFHNPALRKAIYLCENSQSQDPDDRATKQPNELATTKIESVDVVKAHDKNTNIQDNGHNSVETEESRDTLTSINESNPSSGTNHTKGDDDASSLPKCDSSKPNNITGSSISLREQSQKKKSQSNPIRELQLIFARLQFSNKKSIDPYNFIDSLALNAAEQQDAQEFGNLFMEFLEKSFVNQKNEFVSKIIQNQFCGRYSYATICGNCKHSSLSDSKFYELDLSIQKMETLNDCLKEYFRPVPLDGKYNCSNCQQASSAHRKIILKSLPPTLNLQLLRFVYDVQRNSRQKLNSYITFPERLDMSPFLDASSSHHLPRQSRSASMSLSQSYMYTLTAVLIHRGSSPHSGHYIAHIKDRISKDWYKFNDDSVERIGPELNVNTDGESVIVVDNDTKVSSLVPDENGRVKLKFSKSTNLKSKTAYMLVYQAQDNEAWHYPTDYSPSWDLPAHLAEAVVEENSKCDEMFQSLKIAREVSRKMIEERKAQIRSIYSKLVVTSPTDEFEFIDKKWLQDWLTNSSTEATFMPISSERFLCSHNKLDFRRIDQVKCIKSEGADFLYREFGGGPRLKDALCEECVSLEVKHFQLREQMKEDQKYITSQAKFKISAESSFDQCFCIGKDSYRDWQRLVLRNFELEYPEIRNRKKNSRSKEDQESNVDNNVTKSANGDEDKSSSDDDDSFDSFQFNSDLLCEHNRLSQELNNWRIIPKEVWEVFKKYFKKSDSDKLIEFNASESLCEDCKHNELKMLEIGDEKKQRATLIKSKLADLFHGRKRASWDDMIPGSRYYALNRSFLTKWQKFLRNPCNQDEPTSIRNKEKLFCSHDKSLYYHENCNPILADSPLVLLSITEWLTIKEFYSSDAELLFMIDEDLANAKKVVAVHSKLESMKQADNSNGIGLTNGESEHSAKDVKIEPGVSVVDEDIDFNDMEWTDCIVSEPDFCSTCHKNLELDELKKLLNYETATIFVVKVGSPSIHRSYNNSISSLNKLSPANESNSSEKLASINCNAFPLQNGPYGDENMFDDAATGNKRRKRMDVEDEANDFIPPGLKSGQTQAGSLGSTPRRTTRQNKTREQAYTVRPNQTVLELKKEIFSRCQVLPMDQRLFFNETLLDDNNKTMCELMIVPNVSLQLEVDKPNTDTIDLIEDDQKSSRKSNAQPETGFKGSLLLPSSHF